MLIKNKIEDFGFDELCQNISGKKIFIIALLLFVVI